MVNNISDVGMMILIIKWQVLKPLDYYRFRYLVIYSWRLEKWCLCLCLCFQIIFCHTFIPRSFTLMTLAEKETSDPWPVSMEVLKFYLKIVWDVFKKIKIIKNIADLLNRKNIDFSGSEEMTSLLGNLFFSLHRKYFIDVYNYWI